MPHPDTDRAFVGGIPAFYDRLMVPLIFEPYADDLVARIAAARPSRVLEIAAGTGVLTRRLAQRLPGSVEIVATDLNPAMLAQAETVGTARPVRWLVADAMRLPFDDQSFDVVACQFGAMFFPDHAQAFAEARRVLRPGGRLIFNVWDRIEENDFADAVTQGVATCFPEDPPRFLARLPHGWHDIATTLDALRRGGFEAEADVVSVQVRSRADSPRVPAEAFCLGSPLRNEIEARDPARMDAAIEAGARAVAERFGPGVVEGRMRAHVFAVAR